MLRRIHFLRDVGLVSFDDKSPLAELKSNWNYNAYNALVDYKEDRKHNLSQGSEDPNPKSTELAPGAPIPGTGFTLKSAEELNQVISDKVEGFGPPLPNLNLTTQDMNRWKRAWRAYETYTQHRPQGTNSPRTKLETIGEPFVRQCKDWPSTADFTEVPLLLVLSAAAMVYGGLHALAWSAHFGSSTQQLLWRISVCVVVAGCPLVYVILSLDKALRQRLDDYTPAYIYLDIASTPLYWMSWHRSLPIMLAYYLVPLAYTLARAYLVVECFIQLARMPAGVYDVPTWSSYFPHIS